MKIQTKQFTISFLTVLLSAFSLKLSAQVTNTIYGDVVQVKSNSKEAILKAPVVIPNILIQPTSAGVPIWFPSDSLAALGLISNWDNVNLKWWDWDKNSHQWKERPGGTSAADLTFPNSQLKGSCPACALLNYVAGNNYVAFLAGAGVFYRIDDTASYTVDNTNIFWGAKNAANDSLIKWQLIASNGGGNAIDTTNLSNRITNLQTVKVDKSALGYYNVKDYGAKGDGVTDDGPALRALMALVKANGGGEVFFPKGTYIVKRDVNSPFYMIPFGSNMKIHGESKVSTILKLGTDDVFNFRRMFQNYDDGTTIQNVEIYDLAIDMSNTFTTYNPPFTIANGYSYDFGSDAQNNGIFLYSTSGSVKYTNLHDLNIYNVSGDIIGVSRNAQHITIARIPQWNYLRQGISVGGSAGVNDIDVSGIYDSAFTGVVKGGNSIHCEPAYPISNFKLSNSVVTDISISGITGGSIINVTTTDTTASNIANNVQDFKVTGNYFAGYFQIAPIGDNVLVQGGTFNKGLKITSVGVGGLKTYKNIKVEGIISRAYADFALQISNQSNVSVNNSNLTSYSSVALNCSSCVNASFTNNIISIGDTTGNYYAASIGNTSAYYGLGTITFKGNRLSSPYRGVTIANTGVAYGPNDIFAPVRIAATGTYTKYFPYTDAGGKQILNIPTAVFPNYGVYNTGDEITLGSYADGSAYKYICSTAGALYEEVWSAASTYQANAFVKGSDGHIYKSVQVGGQAQDPTTDTNDTYWVDVASTTAKFSGVGLLNMLSAGSGSPEGVVSAPRGALYQDMSAGDIYNKTTVGTLNTGWSKINSGTPSSISTNFWTLQDNGSTGLDFINGSATRFNITSVSSSAVRLKVNQYSAGATATNYPGYAFSDGSGVYLDATGAVGIFPFGATRGYVFNTMGLSLDRGAGPTSTNLKLDTSTATMSSIRVPIVSGAVLPTAPKAGDIASDGVYAYIYNGTAWRRIDRQNTDDLTEGSTNKYYTDARARGAFSLTTTGSGAATYNSSTGVLNIPTPSSSTLGNATVLADANYTVTSNDYSLILPHTTASRTLTLPAASTLQNKILFIQNNGTASSDWVLSGSYFQAGSGASTEDFINSGLDQQASTILVSSKSQDNTWHWWRVASSGTSGGSAGTTTNALTIGAELSPTGATTFNGSAAKTIGIQSGSVTNSMLAGSIAASKLIGTDISTVGTITTGTWHGSAIADTYISSAATWSAKQNALSGTGYAKWSGTMPSYVTTIPINDLDATVATKSGSSQMLFISGSTSTTVTGTQYCTFGNTSLNNTEKNRALIMPRGGTLKSLYVLTGSTQPSDGALVITIERATGNANGTFTPTGLSVTVAANAAQGTFTDVSNTYTVLPGDILSVKYANASASASASVLSVGVLLQE